jgi:putative ABC transport system permease protein
MMRAVALRSLTHDRGKLFGAAAGVAFAAALLLLQIGIYEGFRSTSALLIDRLGGDVWVMARGTEVIDSGEPLSGGSRARVGSVPCVRGVRGVVFAFAPMRKPNGAVDAVQVVGLDAAPSPALVPWSLEHGLPADLHARDRVSVDTTDLGKLHLPRDPRGARVQIGVDGPTVEIAAVTRGIRSFTLTPYVFADLATARRMTRLGPTQVHFWLLDLADASCAPIVTEAIHARSPDLLAMDAPSFRAKTIDYWVGGSGAGAAIGFSALLGLIVGTVIVGQTLYSVTREHERELATLKAIGATRLELASFVAWQAALLAVIGCAVGLLMATAGHRVLADAGLMVVMSPRVLGIAGAAVIGMCAAASVGSLRKVLHLDAAEVFK